MTNQILIKALHGAISEAPSPAIAARNDLDAVSVWLIAKGGRSTNTMDAYRREATRLLAWLEDEALTLAQLNVEDVHRYFEHLASPPPHWIRPRKPKSNEVLLPTQLLLGGLSNRSVDYTRTVLAQLSKYLMDAGYLRRNVFALSLKPPVIRESAPSKVLDLETFLFLQNHINLLPKETAPQQRIFERFSWLIALLYHTGMRREEVRNARMGDFVRRENLWSLRVVGKGSKERFVTCNSILVGALCRYRCAMNLSPYPSPGETMPIVSSLNHARLQKPLTVRAIGLLVKELSDSAAKHCTDPHMRSQLQAMSTHWMRHTNATHRLMAGASLETTQDELGHADLRTTRIYAKMTDGRRQDDAEKLATLAINTTRPLD